MIDFLLVVHENGVFSAKEWDEMYYFFVEM